MEKIKITDVIETNLAVLDKDGVPLFNFLVGKINNREAVELDLSGLQTTSTAFFNYSIGQLYLMFDHAVVDRLINYSNSTVIQKDQIERVVDNAKNYRTHRKHIKEAKELV